MTKNSLQKDIIQDIDIENNTACKIKIWPRKIKAGFHLYLKYSKRGVRQKISTKVYINARPDTYKQDYQNLRLVLRKRNLLEDRRLEDELGFDLTKDKRLRIDFINYAFKLSTERNNVNYLILVKHLRDYTKERNIKNLFIGEVTENFCKSFQKYLLGKEKRQHNGTITKNTVRGYMRYLRVILNQAIEDKIIIENPTKNVILKVPQPERNFLTEQEIIDFSKVETPFLDSQNAFLFACFTGLRFSDIRRLNWSNITEGYIQFRQKKTGRPDRIKLSKNALKILEKQRALHPDSESAFQFRILQTVNNHVKKIANEAKMKKKLSFHCSRHTFATYLLTKGIGIFTVSKLLGHSNINSTLVYAKLVDSVKDDAINSLPEII